MRIKKGDVLKLEENSAFNLLRSFSKITWEKPDFKITNNENIFIVVSDFYFNPQSSVINIVFHIYEKVIIEVTEIGKKLSPIYSVNTEDLLMTMGIEINRGTNLYLKNLKFKHVFDENNPEKTEEKYLKFINKNQ